MVGHSRRHKGVLTLLNLLATNMDNFRCLQSPHPWMEEP
jgi:hypothetical protein